MFHIKSGKTRGLRGAAPVLILAALLAAASILPACQTSNSAARNQTPAPSAGDRPFGATDDLIGQLRSGATPAERVEAADRLQMTARRLHRAGKGSGEIETIGRSLAEAAGRDESPDVRKAALEELQSIIKITCGEHNLHDELFGVLEKRAEADPDSNVRVAVIAAIEEMAECHKGHTADRETDLLLRIVTRDPDVMVLDEAACNIRFARENGVIISDETRRKMAAAVRRYLLVADPDAAWAAFARGPFSFHEWTELHDLLIDGPWPEDPHILYYGLFVIDMSLRFPGPTRPDPATGIKTRLLKYLLYRQASRPETGKTGRAGVGYMNEAARMDEGLSPVELAAQAAKAENRKFTHQAALTLLEGNRLEEVEQMLARDGGLAGVLMEIGKFADPASKNPAAIRAAAWEALGRSYRDEDGQVTNDVPQSVIRQWSGFLARERDPGVRALAEQTLRDAGRGR